mgnify:CR=1 FL=1
MHQPFVEISDSGVNIAHSQPARHVSRKHDYKRRPVNVALHHNLTLEIHGEHFSTSTKLNGRANTMVAVCTAFKPPAINNAKAIPETNTPQIILVRFFGFTSPSVLIVANTKVAESPEVMKNTKIKRRFHYEFYTE